MFTFKLLTTKVTVPEFPQLANINAMITKFKPPAWYPVTGTLQGKQTILPIVALALA